MKHENHSVTCIANSCTPWQSQVELRTLHCRHKVGAFGWRVPWPPASCVSWIIICRNSESRRSFALIVHLNVWSVMSLMFSWGHLQRMLSYWKWLFGIFWRFWDTVDQGRKVGSTLVFRMCKSEVECARKGTLRSGAATSPRGRMYQKWPGGADVFSLSCFRLF